VIIASGNASGPTKAHGASFIRRSLTEATVKMAMKHAANYQAWAIGRQQRNGFHVRRIVWGRVMAEAERRAGERVMPAIIMLKEPPPRKARPLTRAARDNADLQH
jgi:hypothetical protein